MEKPEESLVDLTLHRITPDVERDVADVLDVAEPAYVEDGIGLEASPEGRVRARDGRGEPGECVGAEMQIGGREGRQ